MTTTKTVFMHALQPFAMSALEQKACTMPDCAHGNCLVNSHRASGQYVSCVSQLIPSLKLNRVFPMVRSHWMWTFSRTALHVRKEHLEQHPGPILPFLLFCIGIVSFV